MIEVRRLSPAAHGEPGPFLRFEGSGYPGLGPCIHQGPHFETVSPPRTMAAFDRDIAWQRFYALVDSIPRGRVATYGQIAREAGLPRYARHVGHALRALPPKSELPWHRVINSQGIIPDRGGSSRKVHRSRLQKDGVEVSGQGKVDLRRYQWKPDW